MKTYEIIQFAAASTAQELFRIQGEDLITLKAEAARRMTALEARGVTVLSSLRAIREIVPDTLENRAKYGTGKVRRKAKKLLSSGKYTGRETLNQDNGRWTLPDNQAM